MKTAVYPGVFDPPTLGHLEIIKRAAGICDKLVVAISESTNKRKTAFSIDERKKMLDILIKDMDHVELVSFSGLVVDCALELKADFLIRGLRSGVDFDYEIQMASANAMMTGIQTIFLVSSPQYTHLSSTLIREIAACGGPLQGFVPDSIVEYVRRKN